MADNEHSRRDDQPTKLNEKKLASGLKVFGRYRLESIAGRGGMGVVWKAHDEELGETVALKFLPEIVAGDAVAMDELKEETRRARRLTHPHIVRIHDFLRDGTTAAVSMEFVNGTTLAQMRLAQPGKVFSTETLAPLVAQLCVALDYAHLTGKVVHRDLKPANLLVTKDGQLKVTDFGIARSLSETHTRLTGTITGTSGTLLYMSPQQYAGDKPSAADDIYSLGATLYDLLTSKPPFHRGDAFSLMKQIAERPPLSLAAQRAELEITGTSIPENWELTILACLAKEAKDRPRSAGAVAHRLGLSHGATVRALRSGAPSSDRDDIPNGQIKQTSPPQSKSKLPLLGLLSVVALLGLGSAYYFTLNAPMQPPRPVESKPISVMRVQDEVLAAQAEKKYQDIAVQIAALVDGAPASQRDATAAEVKLYLATASPNNRAAAEKLWVQRLTSWETTEKAAQKTKAEQEEYAAIVAKIDQLLDGTPSTQRVLTETTVKNYLATAPAKYRTDTGNRWTQRLAGWDAARLAAARGGVIVRTSPTGADVTVGIQEHGSSPLTMKDMKLGKYPVKVRATDYEDWSGEVEVTENKVAVVNATLVHSTGMLLLTSEPTDLDADVKGQKAEDKAQKVKTPQSLKLPTGNYQVIFRRNDWPDQTKNAVVTRNGTVKVTGDFVTGKLTITSEPSGAEVVSGGKVIGTTPLTQSEMIPGTHSVELRLKGYTAQVVSGEIAAREELRLNAALEKLSAPEPSQSLTVSKLNGTVEPNPALAQAWENSLGMRFVPVTGTFALFAVWDTRVKDYQAFVDGTQRKWTKPDFPQGPTHPAVNVSGEEAREFCAWLTVKEHSAGRLGINQEYRLPKNTEWNRAAGMVEVSLRGGVDQGVYPWGAEWPPPHGAGNYHKKWKVDDYEYTSPVGSFDANEFGLYDMGGNVWQWCENDDTFSGRYRFQSRGASFSMPERVFLLSSNHYDLDGERYDSVGFRVVLAAVYTINAHTPSQTNSEPMMTKAGTNYSLELNEPKIGQVWKIPELDMLVMQPIAPGRFMMGDGNDKYEVSLKRLFFVGKVVAPQREHMVTLTQPFWLGKTEVTQREWSTVMRSTSGPFPGDDFPVTNISWTEAVEFCGKLTMLQRNAGRLPKGYVYTLPTEAQWEYACRSGTTGDFAGSLDAMGWYDKNGDNTTHQVGKKQANAWGLYDMHGNVWEWCADWYGVYPHGSVTDPTGAPSGTSRVYRGGNFSNSELYCHSAYREGNGPGLRLVALGFRLALSPVR